ncbi:MAG TPA: endonuclease/exonuclease/phosphatase family protein [Polyangiaceae bacterium]|nr:endonuclease/exonuclease/phosphatase family protein [Polyangiaceae bacterium]
MKAIGARSSTREQLISEPSRRNRLGALVLLLCLPCSCCQRSVGASEASPVPAWGASGTLEVASWNVGWFGSGTQGPRDDVAQCNHVASVLRGSNIDVWALTEVVDARAFAELVRELPEYDGLLASDLRVRDGSRFYDSGEQKPAVVFRRGYVKLSAAELILTEADSKFAGRPPLRVSLRVGEEPLELIVLHAKAYADAQSHARRTAASGALQGYLDEILPSAKVLVAGDFNDDIFESISRGRPSPYANFVGAGEKYRFLTAELSSRGLTSTVDHGAMIDHHLASNELEALFIAGSTQVLSVDRYISNYAETTSDHYPVASRFKWPLPSSP